MLTFIFAMFGLKPPSQITTPGTYTYSTNRLGLTWVNTDPNAQIRLYRDGVLSNTLPAGTTDFATGDIEPWDTWTGTAYNGLEATGSRVNFSA